MVARAWPLGTAGLAEVAEGSLVSVAVVVPAERVIAAVLVLRAGWAAMVVLVDFPDCSVVLGLVAQVASEGLAGLL